MSFKIQRDIMTSVVHSIFYDSLVSADLFSSKKLSSETKSTYVSKKLGHISRMKGKTEFKLRFFVCQEKLHFINVLYCTYCHKFFGKEIYSHSRINAGCLCYIGWWKVRLYCVEYHSFDTYCRFQFVFQLQFNDWR